MKKIHPLKKICTLVCLFAMLSISAARDDGPPQVKISNGLIQAHLYLPDGEKGYYRATRFDWSGVMSSLQFAGHEYYGQWYEKYGPTINDAIMGPVEAFDPLGYDDAKAGENFVKIGVGALTKADNAPYNFAAYYPIVNAGKWSVKAKTDQVEFLHSLNDVTYGYEYKKAIKLLKGKPVMVISHTLKNTGTKAIETAVFNHNFFVMDKQITGPGFEVTFPVADEKINPRIEDLVKLDGTRLSFLKELTRRNASFKDLTDGKGAAYSIKVENTNTGAGVNITADKPISKLVFWSAAKTLCPEPYINVKIQPGQVFSWSINYEYYVKPKPKPAN